MSSPSLPALQRLHFLDRSLPEFRDQLLNILYGEEYTQCVPNLQGDDSKWFVEYLDSVLDGLDPSSSAFRKCLRELKSICGNGGMLPASYMLSSSLLKISPNPFISGGFGDVYEGNLNGSTVCVKRVRMYTKDGPEKATKIFCREAVMWKRLTHPNILPLLGVTFTPLQLISNWMSGGDLLEYVKNHPDADRLGLLSDIAKGLCYLHSCNVVHGDLKGPNILVDDSGIARIADFGLAAVTRNLDSIRSDSCQNGQTSRWAAPEVLKEGAYSKEADIFAFAMVTIEVFTGAVPFSNEPSVTVMLAIIEGKRPPRPVHPTFTEDLWTLVQHCWDRDPHSRPEVSEILRVLITPEHPVWKQLINNTLAIHDRIPLITMIFSDDVQIRMVENLSGDDAQNFIDLIEGVLDSLTPEIRKRCLCYLYKYPLCHGGSADVWKGKFNDQEVAAKVLRVYSRNDLGRITSRFCREVVAWRALHHPNVLQLLGVTVTENRFVMVSEWMAKGNIDEFVTADTNTDRLGLLGDVTSGLIYMHDQGIIHGNLNGANILIGNDGRACLAGFGLLTITSGQSNVTSLVMTGGTIRWMGPERFDPERFGLKENRPTKESDCYALGMVIYEVLSGQTPYATCNQLVVVQKILAGERPARPQGAQGTWFTTGLWRMLEDCWKPQPGDRPSLNAVLRCLQDAKRPSNPFEVDVEVDVETNPDDKSYVTASEPRPRTAHDHDGPLAPPQPGGSKDERFGDRLARSVKKIFKGIS